MSVVRSAPGKLFVAGEYAVLEPGSPAVLASVDRHVTVSATAADTGLVIDSDLVDEPLCLSGTKDGFPAGTSMSHVVAAVQAVSDLLADDGRRLPPIHLTIHSGLHHAGVKIGLGSSGAVTVATIDATLAFCGLSLTTEERFRLALLASVRLDPRASGGDLAAGTWGGWILYRAPDRAAVAALARDHGVKAALEAPWAGFEVRRVPPPSELAVEVGWTGQPASTSDKVASTPVRAWRGSKAHREFARRSDGCVTALADALDRREHRLVLKEIRRARRLLADADDESGLGIFTDGLTALCDAAEAVGGAGKPSGAGGGDCGIALLEPDQRVIDRMRARWLAVGVAALPIKLSEPERTHAGDR